MGAVKVAREEHSDARGNNHLMELMEEQTVKNKRDGEYKNTDTRWGNQLMQRKDGRVAG